ncbi:MAG TPA: RNB domain-containing ribonuclease, partial [Thermoanaerobaculia bacterium]|nr:RNB domain-containing ribonuclease [Thermoanaerobaculia bacterium]
IYTAAMIFPMLPEKLSTDLTSLNDHEERLSLVIDMQVSSDGSVAKGDVYRAQVHNKAQLAYNATAAWLEGEGPMPEKVAAVPGLDRNLKLQSDTAQKLRELRHEHGALDLETIEAKAVLTDGAVVDLKHEKTNSAKQLIEDFMIAANGVTARFLDAKGSPSIRRVVRSPERWDRIEAIAATYGDKLPPDPDAKALEEFLVRRRKADPLRFPDLSLMIVKAMGPGEYVLELPGQTEIGHFGLAVRDYTHSTAPNRRFPDLITHRLVKAVLTGAQPPYSKEELSALADHCTSQEDAANKVERQVRKSAGAALLEKRIGDRFDGVVTGASAKGTWVRIFQPPVEGKLVHGHEGLDLGDRVHVKLISVDIEAGYIDFARVH